MREIYLIIELLYRLSLKNQMVLVNYQYQIFNKEILFLFIYLIKIDSNSKPTIDKRLVFQIKHR